jgi:hypothetical protein
MAATDAMKFMPWIQWLDLDTELGDDGSMRSSLRRPKPEHINHNGHVNAAVAYGVAEVAGAGAAVMAAGAAGTGARRAEASRPPAGSILQSLPMFKGPFKPAKDATSTSMCHSTTLMTLWSGCASSSSAFGHAVPIAERRQGLSAAPGAVKRIVLHAKTRGPDKCQEVGSSVAQPGRQLDIMWLIGT